MFTFPFGNLPSYFSGTLYGSCDETENNVAIKGCFFCVSLLLKNWKNGSSQMPQTPSNSASLLNSVLP